MRTTGYPYLDNLRRRRPSSSRPRPAGRPTPVARPRPTPPQNTMCQTICRAWQSRTKNILVPQVAKNDLRVIMSEIDKKAATMNGNQNAAYEAIRNECGCGLPSSVDMQGNLAVSFRSNTSQTLQGPVIAGRPSQLTTYKNFGGEITTGVISVGQYVMTLLGVGALFFVVGYSLELGKEKA